MALVAPLLITLLFAIFEIGYMLWSFHAANQAAREGTRAAATGATLSAIDTRIRGSSTAIDTSQITWSGAYRVPSGGAWSAWATLGNVGSGADVRNNAPSGSQVRIEITYPHHLVCGPLFARFASAGTPGVVNLRARLIMRRE
jgi:Flp pilus assembly protein TadG